MSWRRLAVLGISAWMLVVAAFSLISYSWSAELAKPANAPATSPASASFRCGALWGSATVHGPRTTAYPVIGTPCGQRTKDQVMTGVDVAIGVLAIFVVATWGPEGPARRLFRQPPLAPGATTG